MLAYNRLAIGSALLAVAVAGAVPADAKPHKRAAARHRTDPRDAEIKALEAKVDALTQRLEAVESGQQATAHQAQSAQAAAAAAQSQATTALGQSQMAQAQATRVETQVTPPLEKAIKNGWFANTSVSGKVFLNTSNIHQTSTDLAGNQTDNIQNGYQTELKRFYVGIDHKFNDVFSANITTDFRYNSNYTVASAPSRDVLIYVKKAFLQAKLDPAFIIRAGAADLPWVPFDESVYGYRFVENTLIDRTKFGTSSDWGIHILGSFAKNLVSYQVSAINGGGYKSLTRNSDTVDFEGRVSVNPIKPVTLAIGGYTGKLDKSNATVNVNHRATRFNALAAYSDKRIRAGVEYFHATNWNNIATANLPNPAPNTPDDKAHGWSGFGSFAFTPRVSAFGRYDWVKPTGLRVSGTTGTVEDHYLNLGVDFKPINPIDLAIVYKHERTNNGFLSTSNGTIGGLDHGSYDEVGIFGQVAF